MTEKFRLSTLMLSISPLIGTLCFCTECLGIHDAMGECVFSVSVIIHLFLYLILIIVLAL